MNYYLDTEFAENGKTIDLISIAIVRADGLEYYAESMQFDAQACNEWVKRYVLPHLGPPNKRLTRAVIAKQVQDFLLSHPISGKPKVYGYFADYDWVALCQLFGTMMQLPKGLPMYCRDLKQILDERELGKDWVAKHCPQPEAEEHHALNDARWNAELHRAILAA
jgi:hypothetical protein